MRKVVPQRVVRSRIHKIVLLLLLFTTTLVVCLTFFFITISVHGHIISPLGYSKKNTTESALVSQVQSECHSEKLVCQHITLQGDTIELVLDTGVVAYLSPSKSVNQQLASLQKVASQLTINGRQLKSVDFRYSNVVVSY